MASNQSEVNFTGELFSRSSSWMSGSRPGLLLTEFASEAAVALRTGECDTFDDDDEDAEEATEGESEGESVAAEFDDELSAEANFALEFC